MFCKVEPWLRMEIPHPLYSGKISWGPIFVDGQLLKFLQFNFHGYARSYPLYTVQSCLFTVSQIAKIKIGPLKIFPLYTYSQVNELEGELPLQKMQLSQVVKEKDSLQKQLDTLTVQLANSESQVGREKIKATTLQVHTCTITHCVWDSFKLC